MNSACRFALLLLFMVFSADDGRTWTPPVVVNDSPVDDRNPARGHARDGTPVVGFWRTATYDDAGKYAPKLDEPHGTGVTRSTDGERQLNETALLRLASGNMLAAIRSRAGDVWISHSADEAPTWSAPQLLALAGVSGEPARAADHAAAPIATAEPQPELAFRAGCDFAAWQQALRRRLIEILALPAPPFVPLDATRQRESETEGYTLDRIQFISEPGEVVPGYLLVPVRGTPPFPVMICLQGHSPGMHISIGQAANEREKASIAGGRDIALQAVGRRWAALVIEQRAFGRRAVPGVSCQDAALRALLRGRPLTGLRVLDVIRAVDFIVTQADLDPQRIATMGNSMGGTVSFYAACVEPRIRLAVVSCSFCTFADSWLLRPHCACGYLPGLARVADLPDLAGLIAPRHLLIVAGKQDALARFEGVEEGCRRAGQAFAAAGVGERVTLLAAEGEHRFYPDLAWPEINRVREQW